MADSRADVRVNTPTLAPSSPCQRTSGSQGSTGPVSLENKLEILISHAKSQTSVVTCRGSVCVLGVCPVLPAQWHVCEYLCEQGAHRQHEELGGGRCHRPDPWRSCKHFPCRLACEPACEPLCYCCWSPSNLKPPSQEFDVYKPSKPRGQQGSQPHSGCYLEQLTPGSGKGVYLGGAQQADATAFLKLRQTPPRAVQ